MSEDVAGQVGMLVLEGMGMVNPRTVQKRGKGEGAPTIPFKSMECAEELAKEERGEVN
jgi:hypothetical protein